MSFPDRKALAICGDGGFMMNVQDLETAVRLKLPMVILILDRFPVRVDSLEAGGSVRQEFTHRFREPRLCETGRSVRSDRKAGRVGRPIAGDPGRGHSEADGPVVIDCPVDYDENMKLSRRLGEIPAATRSHWLKQTDLFSGCGSDSLEVISSFMEERSYQAGASICEEGVDGSEVFLLVDGEAVVQASGGDQAGPISLGPGACFGEMAIPG